MKTRKAVIASLAFLFLSLQYNVFAQTVRDFCYYPDGRGIVCINGSHRFTRALYGNHSGFRVETSDRPVFAIFQPKNECVNIRFDLYVGQKRIALDSTDYCEARYEAGKRSYVLRDKRLNGGEIKIEVLADGHAPYGIWHFDFSKFNGITSKGQKLNNAYIKATVCETAVQKFKRAGDIVKFTQPGCFEASPSPKNIRQLNIKLKKNIYFAVNGGDVVAFSEEPQETLSNRFSEIEKERKSLASILTINTPDPWLNTVGGNMVIAADGAWDGDTWLHGAIGWRMQLPGWRGAYMGDFMGMPKRQRSHFDAYAESQVTDVPVTKPHLMDSANNLARGAYVWGTPMYSNGYICRSPHNNHLFHHYDMNLSYIDELLWHFEFDADTAYMRRMWPVLTCHLAWEKNTWDPDSDSLYDAYCCIWASDALQYNSGAVTHSSAYNYRANLLAARIAEIIGENPKPYKDEAEKILKAMNSRLWMADKGVWAEFQDFMGLKRLHESPALWTIYTPIDSKSCSAQQAYEATKWIDRNIPHIPFVYNGEKFTTLATTSWMPYEWSLNNVAMAEVMHTALAYYEAGRANEATRLLKSNVIDFMYAGSSPGNFGQLSTLDRNTGEGYRDFADATGISSRTIVQGLFGITPDALNGRCIIRPGFPHDWDSASIKTPYLEYSFKRIGGKEKYEIKQHFAHPLTIVIRQNTGYGNYKDTVLGSDSVQIASLNTINSTLADTLESNVFAQSDTNTLHSDYGTELGEINTLDCKSVDISRYFNASVTDIFKQKYLSPRSPYTTLCLPKQGIGDWCSTKRTADIDDSALRTSGGVLKVADVPFITPAKGNNIAFSSLWDNFPDSITIPLKGKAEKICLLLAGSTNPMQSRFDNGELIVTYSDGSTKTLSLRNPDNWCPIEQDYDEDGLAFHISCKRPYRLSLKTGLVSRTLAQDMHINNVGSSDEPEMKQPMLSIPGGAAELLAIDIDKTKRLKGLTVKTTANDVVIGLLGITLVK